MSTDIFDMQIVELGEIYLFSWHEEDDASYTEGLTLVLSISAQKVLLEWESHGPRIIKAVFRIKHKKLKLNIIQCHAPTNDSDKEDKHDFYDWFQDVQDKCPLRVKGDLNAKIGEDNTSYEELVDRQGLGEMSDNGEWFCALNGLVIGGTIFPQDT